MRRALGLGLVLLGLLAGATPARAQLHAFRFDAGAVPVGRLYEYLKSNRDGSRPARVSLYVAGTDRLEALKWAPGDSTATLVVAVMDWTRFSVRRLESWALARSAIPVLRATLETDPAGDGVRVSFQPDQLLPIHRWPWHSYDFDFASLNLTLSHLLQPEAGFEFERADIVYAPGGPPFADLGPVEVRFVAREERQGIAVRRYRLSGSGLEGHSGDLWVAIEGQHIVEYSFPFPDEPGYTDGRLRLQEVRALAPEAWERYRRQRLGEP